MTPQELKNSILQLAIQGKLVEQRPEEGTGEELYQQIQKERQALIKAGKIKKGKPLPEIAEDEVPLEIPETWKWVKLAEICTIATGKRDANFGSSSGRYPFFTCAKEPIRCESFSFEGESLLLAGNGDIGNISYYCGQFEAYQRTYVLQPYIEMSYCLYLYYHIQANWVQYNMGKIYGTAIPYIRLGNIQNYYVALPPLTEQKRIVAKIEELLPLIDRYEQAWNRLEDFNRRFPADLRKSILQMAIQGKLVEQRPEEGTGEELYRQIQREKRALVKAGKLKKQKALPEVAEDEVPFEVPESWKWVRLGNVTSVLGGKRIPAGRQLTKENTGHIYIRVSDMKNDSVDTDHLMYVPSDIYPSISRYIIYKEDIYITVAGTIGRVGIIPSDLDGANLTENADRLVFQIMDQKWLLQCLKSYVIQSQIADATTKVGQPKLAIKRIQDMIIPLPPLADQKRIVAKVEELMAVCEGLM